MSDTLTERKVQMTADDWRAVADEAREHAVGWLNQPDQFNRAGALEHAASLLRAADTFAGRANHLDMFDGVDEATIEA